MASEDYLSKVLVRHQNQFISRLFNQTDLNLFQNPDSYLTSEPFAYWNHYGQPDLEPYVAPFQGRLIILDYDTRKWIVIGYHQPHNFIFLEPFLNPNWNESLQNQAQMIQKGLELGYIQLGGFTLKSISQLYNSEIQENTVPTSFESCLDMVRQGLIERFSLIEDEQGFLKSPQVRVLQFLKFSPPNWTFLQWEPSSQNRETDLNSFFEFFESLIEDQWDVGPFLEQWVSATFSLFFSLTDIDKQIDTIRDTLYYLFNKKNLDFQLRQTMTPSQIQRL